MKFEGKKNLEEWFLTLNPNSFPNNENYVSYYTTLKEKLKPVHKQVTQGADVTDGTSLTWHDESHIQTVIDKVSALLLYSNAEITAFEAFILLIAIQIHDIMNSDGREEHEGRAIEILQILGLSGVIDSVTTRTIGKIVNCHSGTFERTGIKEKDKISYLVQHTYQLKGQKVRMQFLAALLRLGDEYADNEDRAMSYLLQLGKIQKTSEVHHKYAECLHSVDIIANSGITKLDFHIGVQDAVKMFDKYIKEKQTVEKIYLIDEVFSRILKCFYETIYCMRFLRPDISITKIAVHIEIEVETHNKELFVDFELVERGYPLATDNILDLIELRLNGSYWSGSNLKEYIEKHGLK
jgi:hypothetical protein